MNLTTIFLLAVALGTDAFSMAVGIGISGIRRTQALMISGVICLFHIFMPLTGLLLGAVLGRAVGQFGRIIGAGILIALGAHGLVDVSGLKELAPAILPTGGASPVQRMRVASGPTGVLLLAGSVSLDALTVGFGLGTFNVNLPFAVLTFGLVAGLMTAAGFSFGSRIGTWLGEKAETTGAIILVLIGLKMLLG